MKPILNCEKLHLSSCNLNPQLLNEDAMLERGYQVIICPFSLQAACLG